MTSTRTLARVAGLLYLVVAVCGGFSEYVRTSAVVPGDAAATAANVASRAGIFHVAFVADLVDLPCFIAVGVLLYVMLRSVDPGVAISMVVLNAVSVAIQAINMLSHLAALLVATQPGLTVGLPSEASQSLVLLLLNMHQQGYLVAQIFFGLFLVPLGYLVSGSGLFPRLLGYVLMIGGAGYLAGIAADWLSTTFVSSAATYFGLIGGLAELLFVMWLLIVGSRAAKGALA